MRLARRVLPVLAAVALPMGLSIGIGQAKPIEASVGTETWTQEAEAEAPGQNDVSPQDADGSTWAPGGAFAQVSIYVRGQGTHVDTSEVAYHTGTDIGNACTDTFEISYYEGGVRKEETMNGHCTPLRVAHTFQINRSLDAQSPFCGRVLVGGQWSDYACIDILP